MIKNVIYCSTCIVSFFVCIYTAKAQDEIVVTDIKAKRCNVNFSLQNIGVNNFEFDPVVSYKKGKFTPHYYSYIKDTLEINLENRKDEIQSGGSINVKIIIDGERRNTSKILKPNEKLYFTVRKNKNIKIRVIKLILSKSHILYSPVQ